MRARVQYTVCVELFAAELGASPGPAVEAALREALLAAAVDNPCLQLLTPRS